MNLSSDLFLCRRITNAKKRIKIEKTQTCFIFNNTIQCLADNLINFGNYKHQDMIKRNNKKKMIKIKHNCKTNLFFATKI